MITIILLEYPSNVSFRLIKESTIDSNLSLLSTIKHIAFIGIFLIVLYCNLKVGIISSKALNPGKSKIILSKSLEDTIWTSLVTEVVLRPVLKCPSVNNLKLKFFS